MAVHLSLFGTFFLAIDDVPITPSPAAQRLIACIALQGRQCFRSAIAGRLWPYTTEKQALSRLRHVVWEVRAISPELISGDGGRLAIAESVTVDVRRALGSVFTGLTALDLAALTPADLRARYGHDLLEDWDYDWLEPHRAALREWRIRTLEGLSAQAAMTGHSGIAAQAALLALQSDPYRETAIRLLIDACLHDGNRAVAYRYYDDFARRLVSECGVEPTPSLVEVVRRQELIGASVNGTSEWASSSVLHD
jgi:DNA-binding SARP family transcriptional activator